MTRYVWQENLDQEMEVLAHCMPRYPYVAFDTEFPGFIHEVSRNASDADRYTAMKKNVDSTKLIQLGITLSDRNGMLPYPGCCWQFTFSGFDPSVDLHNATSIELLRHCGVDFEKSKQDGVDCGVFSILFCRLLARVRVVSWITFHGSYDIGYLLKTVTQSPLPDKLHQFARTASEILGNVYDTKYMARFFPDMMGGELGLSRLAEILHVDREGQHHQAGYDSLHISSIFSTMKWRMNWMMDPETFKSIAEASEGVLYGAESEKIRTPSNFQALALEPPTYPTAFCHLPPPPPPYSTFPTSAALPNHNLFRR